MVNKVPVLFDVNGVFGREAAGNNDCPAMAERLAHMNRLGISRSLVWNVETTQNHTLSANEHTLDAIAETRGAKGRIYPALNISGLIIYERNGVQKLKRQMVAGGTRALKFFNTWGRLSLSQLVPVISSIRAQKPFIVMGHSATNQQDILDFTARFPDVSLVITDVMWPTCIIVFDLMRQRKNIMLDISWLHTWEGIELAVKRFGAKRVVFGTGYRAHNGAAIAALSRAQISEFDRQLIAHGNLDRLMGLKEKKTKAIAGTANKGNSLWQKCLAGEKLGVDIIDAHAHLGPSAGYVLENQDEDDQIRVGKKVMGSLGMNLMVVSGLHALLGDPVFGNDFLAKKLKNHGSHFAAYVTFNPLYADELVKKFNSYFNNPLFIGFKTLCSYWKVPITDKRFEPMWRYANRHHLPMLMHSWGANIDSPIMIDKLAKRYPNVSFLIGHSGGTYEGREEAEKMGKKHPNVYLEWCGSFCNTRSWLDTLDKVGPRKVVFGTDAMVHGIDWEIGRLLSLDVPDSIIRPILGENMRRILAKRRK